MQSSPVSVVEPVSGSSVVVPGEPVVSSALLLPADVSAEPGPADVSFGFGAGSQAPLVGDWNGF